jgi:hypothetical protein
MEAVRTKKKKAGRPKKNIKKEVRTAIRFTKPEHFIVKEKAKSAGIKVSDFVRRAAINAEIKTRLTEEERITARGLVGLSNNMNQIAKACHDEGALKAMTYFQNYRNQIDELLKKLKP